MSAARHPAYRRLLAAVLIGQTGDWLLFIALPLYVLHGSGSALSTATVFLAELIPAVLVGSVAGSLLDRRRVGPMLSGLMCLQAALLAPLLALGHHQLWVIYAVAAAQAAATSLTTPGLQTLVPDLVKPAELPGANALVELVANAARLAGAPLGGALLPVLGLRALVIGDMLSFVLAAALLVRCRRTVVAKTAPALRGRASAGWHAVRAIPTLRCALVIAFLGAVAQGMFLVLFVLFVLRALHAGDQVVGLLRGVQAIGGVLGGLAVGAVAARMGARALAIAGLAGFGAISLLTWNSPGLTTETWWYATLFVVVGVPGAALAAGLITGTQSASPAAVRGRVLSLAQVSDALGQGAGILAAGLLAGHLALGVLLNVQACFYLGCAVVATVGFGRPERSGPAPAGVAWPSGPETTGRGH